MQLHFYYLYNHFIVVIRCWNFLVEVIQPIWPDFLYWTIMVCLKFIEYWNFMYFYFQEKTMPSAPSSERYVNKAINKLYLTDSKIILNFENEQKREYLCWQMKTEHLNFENYWCAIPSCIHVFYAYMFILYFQFNEWMAYTSWHCSRCSVSLQICYCSRKCMIFVQY